MNSAIALILVIATLKTFDRCLGRVAETHQGRWPTDAAVRTESASSWEGRFHLVKRRFLMHRLPVAVPMVLVTVLAIGGSGLRADEPTGSIQGTIKFGLYPLPRGKVVAPCRRAPAKSARIEDGGFAMDRLASGTFRVAIDAEGIPKRYADPASSGLTIQVKVGRNAIRFDLQPEGIEPGQPAPHLMAQGPDGNIVIESHLRGKVVLLAFWRIGSRGAASEAQYDLLRQIRREFRQSEDFQMISLCADAMEVEGGGDAWNEFVIGQGRVDYGDGRRRFIDDNRWWQCTGIAGVFALPAAPRFGVTRQPQLFLIDRQGRFAAVRIPEEKLRGEIRKALASDK